MGNGCRQFAHRRQAAEMSDLFMILSRFGFSELARRYVNGNTNEPGAFAIFASYTASPATDPAQSSIR